MLRANRSNSDESPRSAATQLSPLSKRTDSTPQGYSRTKRAGTSLLL
jgi:hypothetical protein